MRESYETTDSSNDVTQAEADAAYERIMSSSLVSNLEKNAYTLMYKQASFQHIISENDVISGDIEQIRQAFHIAKYAMKSSSYKIKDVSGKPISLMPGKTGFLETYQRNTTYRRETMKRLISTPITSLKRFAVRILFKILVFPLTLANKVFYPNKINDMETLKTHFVNTTQKEQNSPASVPKNENVSGPSNPHLEMQDKSANEPEFVRGASQVKPTPEGSKRDHM